MCSKVTPHEDGSFGYPICFGLNFFLLHSYTGALKYIHFIFCFENSVSSDELFLGRQLIRSKTILPFAGKYLLHGPGESF